MYKNKSKPDTRLFPYMNRQAGGAVETYPDECILTYWSSMMSLQEEAMM